MSADDLGLGRPEEFEPDSRAESIRQGGIGVLSIAVLMVTAPAWTRASSSLSQKPRRDQRLNRL